jgi:hypothetical protein
LPTDLIFRGNRKYGIGNIRFDLLLTESHNFSSNISVHPVEDGSQISDHIQNIMESGSVSALISNFSLRSAFLTSNRAQDAFDALVALWQERTLVTLVTVMRVYENVAIANMPVARDADTGEAIVIQIDFQKVEVVKLQSIELEVAVKVNDLDSAQNKQVAPKVDSGRTTATPAG